MSSNDNRDAGLTGPAVESWTVSAPTGETKYVCFKNKRGELFYFVKSKLMRGKPTIPRNSAEEVSRPASLLTRENASYISGISPASLEKAIQRGHLRAIKKTWKYGYRHRSGLFIDIHDLEQYMAKKAIEKYKGRMIEWDMDPLRLIREAAQ